MRWLFALKNGMLFMHEFSNALFIIIGKICVLYTKKDNFRRKV